MSKHTKGEWYSSRYGSNEAMDCSINVYCDKDFNHPKVAKMLCGNVEEQLSNAKLIAAAPDLLEALQEVLKCERSVVVYGGRNTGKSQLMSVLQSAEKAIKKAIGE